MVSLALHCLHCLHCGCLHYVCVAHQSWEQRHMLDTQLLNAAQPQQDARCPLLCCQMHGWQCMAGNVRMLTCGTCCLSAAAALGSRIKYLVDTPEMIWGCLDSRQYLEGAKRFLRAR
jgi:hypothetical protein